MADTCKFSTYGYACRKPVEHGRYLCEEHASAKCASCGQSATHGCDFCGQFVCGMPLCDECTFGTDETKSSGAWGFMNHIHVSKPEFADEHENVRLKAALAAKDAKIAKLRMALDAATDWISILSGQIGDIDLPMGDDRDPRVVERETLSKIDSALKEKADPHAEAKAYLASRPDRAPTQTEIDDDESCGGFV